MCVWSCWQTLDILLLNQYLWKSPCRGLARPDQRPQSGLSRAPVSFNLLGLTFQHADKDDCELVKTAWKYTWVRQKECSAGKYKKRSRMNFELVTGTSPKRAVDEVITTINKPWIYLHDNGGAPLDDADHWKLYFTSCGSKEGLSYTLNNLANMTKQ